MVMKKSYEDGFSDGTHRMMDCLAEDPSPEYLNGMRVALARSLGRIDAELSKAEERDAAAWAEYDAAADWCASRGFTGGIGTPLPDLSERAAELVEADPEAFAERVRGHAYARAMEIHAA